MDNISDIVKAAQNRDPVTFKDLFNQEMSKRINARMDEVRNDICQGFGCPEETVSEEEVDETEEVVSEEEGPEDGLEEDLEEESDEDLTEEDLEDDVDDQIDETHYGRKNVSGSEKANALARKRFNLHQKFGDGKKSR